MGFAALNVFAMIFLTLFIVGMIWVAIKLYFKWRRYNEFDCTVFETTGFGQQIVTHDKAGIFVDSKTGDKKFFLRKGNIGLKPDQVPYIPGSYGRKCVYLLKSGLKDYRYLRFNMTEDDVTADVGEEDVNWAIHVYEKQKKMFATSWFVQYGPFLSLAFVSIVILTLFIFFFRKLDVLVKVAQAFESASAYLSAANAGTVVIP